MSKQISRAYTMISDLEKELGSLDHLVFAFPGVLSAKTQTYEPPSIFCAAALARSHDPPTGAVVSTVNADHPLPSDYIEPEGIGGVEVIVTSNSAKKLLKRKRCLVIERWGSRFVCRVPHYLRDGIGNGTIGLVDVPPDGWNWSFPIVKKLQEVSRSLSEHRP